MADRLHANDLLAIHGPVGIEFEETLPLPDGSDSHWLTYKFPVHMPDGRRMLGGMSINMTARQCMEAELRKANSALANEKARLASFVEHAPVAIAMVDRDMRYISTSKRWSAEYRLGDAPLIGRSHYEIFPNISEDWRAVHARCLGGAVERREADTWRPDGWNEDQILLWEVRPWYDAAGEIGGLVMLTQDISEQQHREKEHARLRENAEAANIVKSQFLAHMSHEIRTPLTSIFGYADLLCVPDISLSDRQQYVQTIRRNGEHLLAVINDVLDVSKIEAGKMTLEHMPTSLPLLLGEMVSLMKQRASAKGLKLGVRFKTPIPEKFVSDPTRVRQILINLIGNAIKFTDHGSVEIRLSYEAPASRIVIEVEDTGIGMTPEHRVALFQSFTQVDSSHARLIGGTGLGLSISQKLAQMLGGEITACSQIGRGSIFTLGLPAGDVSGVAMVDALASAMPQLMIAPQATVTLHGRVLVAEDSVDSQRLIAAYLQRAGAEVSIVENGTQAIAEALAAEQEHRAYDLILMDCQMPETDGYTATRTLRARGYHRPIVALTANAMSHERDLCLAAGSDHFLTKPIQTELFLRVVSGYLRRGRARPTRGKPTGPVLRSKFDGDQIIGPLIASFLDELRERVDQLAAATRASDRDAVSRIAHDIKGTAGSYGYPTITLAAENLERTARSDALADFAEPLAELTELCQQAARVTTRNER